MTQAGVSAAYGAGAASAGLARSRPYPDDDTIRSYLPLVRRVVRRMAARLPANVEIDELVSWGLSGLLDAMRTFDPAKRASFETYAQLRIRGAILDHLRGEDWAARSLRQKANKLERAYRDLEGRLGRPASEEEVAAELGMELRTLHALLDDLGRGNLLSLEDVGLEAERTAAELEMSMRGAGIDPMQAVLARERVAIVAGAVGRLPEKEKTVISLYYHEGLTMREVGAVLALTESRVSQLHSQALLRLRGSLAKHFGKERR
jgi:RNA polymerase sigma factor for flagellar operon FliA